MEREGKRDWWRRAQPLDAGLVGEGCYVNRLTSLCGGGIAMVSRGDLSDRSEHSCDYDIQ